MNIENALDYLLRRRIVVLGILAAVLLLSLVLGFMYNSRVESETRARLLFDDAWQKVFVVLNEMQNQPEQRYTPDLPVYPQVKLMYQEAAMDLEALVYDYSDTVAAARAVLLIQTMSQLSNINLMLDDPSLMPSLVSQIDTVKEKHPDFWGSVIALNEAVLAEQKLDFTTAYDYYHEALSLDKQKYIADYILVALGRNQETLNNKELALEYYQRAVDEYPESVWLSFAMGKLYTLSQ